VISLLKGAILEEKSLASVVLNKFMRSKTSLLYDCNNLTALKLRTSFRFMTVGTLMARITHLLAASSTLLAVKSC